MVEPYDDESELDLGEESQYSDEDIRTDTNSNAESYAKSDTKSSAKSDAKSKTKSNAKS